MNTHFSRPLGKFLGSLALALPFAMGCGDASVLPRVNLIDKTTQPLSLGSFLEINGQYGSGCTSRTGNWSIGMGGFSQLTNTALTVVKNDIGCSLSASSLRVGASMSNSLYLPPSAVSLGSSYLSSAVSFATLAGGTPDFYGNLRIQPDLSFASDFTLNVVYSDDPSLLTSSAIATYSVQSATATSGSVAAPDYSLDMSTLLFQVDAGKVVQSVSGTASLTSVTIAAQHFVVSTTDLGTSPSFADVDAEYRSGTAVSLSGTDPTISYTYFGLGAVDLTTSAVRTLILANTSNGTTSYEVFQVTFNAP